MLDIKGSDIYLTRGDTAVIEVWITSTGGGIYRPEVGDRLCMTVKRSISDSTVAIKKEVTKISESGGSEIVLDPSDTKHLPFGRYLYDVELQTIGGAVHTIITPSAFHICEEVG